MSFRSVLYFFKCNISTYFLTRSLKPTTGAYGLSTTGTLKNVSIEKQISSFFAIKFSSSLNRLTSWQCQQQKLNSTKKTQTKTVANRLIKLSFLRSFFCAPICLSWNYLHKTNCDWITFYDVECTSSQISNSCSLIKLQQRNYFSGYCKGVGFSFFFHWNCNQPCAAMFASIKWTASPSASNFTF